MIQEYSGRCRYRSDHELGPYSLVLAVPCIVGHGGVPVHALLDTASELCVLPPDIATEMGYDLDRSLDDARLHSRFGTISGRIERIPLSFFAEEGEPVTVQATCFLSPDWTGPTVIGWKGCLERIRFGFDPTQDLFYFAEA